MRDPQRELYRMWTRGRAPVMLVNFNADERDMYHEYLGYMGFVSLTVCEPLRRFSLRAR